jgi:hypothetical protein
MRTERSQSPNLILDVLVNIVSVVGGAVLSYIITKEAQISPWKILVILAVYLVLLGLVLTAKLFTQSELRAARRAEREATARAESSLLQTQELQLRTGRDERDEAIELLKFAIGSTTRILRILSEQFRLLGTRGIGVRKEKSIEMVELRRHLLEELSHGLRTVFESDKRGIDTTTFPYNWYKIALYQPNDLDDPQYLRRTFYDYPEGIEPGQGSDVFDLAEKDRAAVVLSFKHQRIEVIEDIPTEVTKDEPRWVDCRPGQSKEYASMVCAAIVSGKKGQPGRKCLGVIVVDTNRKRYFLETREFKAFLGSVLNPFRTLLTIILELRFAEISGGHDTHIQDPK